MTPDKIYLNIHPDWTEGENEPEVTWSEVEDPFYNNIPYIRKEALLEWANEKLELIIGNGVYAKGKRDSYQELIKHIESL